MRRREFVKAVAAISAAGLEADTLAADRSESVATNESPGGPTLSYSGWVTDKVTGKPIAGATITVRRSILPDPKTGDNRVLQETKHQTDAEGKYHFTIPPEQSAERLLNRLTLEAEAWAESGTRKGEEVPLRREPIWRGYPRLDPPGPKETTRELAKDQPGFAQIRKAG